MSASLIASYLAGVQSLNELTAGIPTEYFSARPIPGMWSIQEVVCHLADSESLFANRMKRVLTEERPELPFADPVNHVAALAYHTREVALELAMIDVTRRQMASILSVQPHEAWLRVGIHSRDGECTLEQLLQKAVVHLTHHLEFVLQKRERLALPWAQPQSGRRSL